jgi:hypothetical protein
VLQGGQCQETAVHVVVQDSWYTYENVVLWAWMDLAVRRERNLETCREMT